MARAFSVKKDAFDHLHVTPIVQKDNVEAHVGEAAAWLASKEFRRGIL